MGVFLFLILVAVVPGLIGVLAEGPMYLLDIGIAVLVLGVAFFAVGRSRRARPARQGR